MFNIALLAPIALLVVLAAGSVFIINSSTPGEDRKHTIRFLATYFVPMMLLAIGFMTLLSLTM